MDPCREYQSRLLDYLYDLLEAPEARQLDGHLEQCAACQAALWESRAQSRLFAAAARLEFPGVHFEPPRDELAGVEPLAEPRSTLPLARPPRLAWRRWAVAAAVLLAISVPAWFGADYLGARRAYSRHQERIAHLSGKRDDTARQVRDLGAERAQMLAEREKEVRRRHLNVVVSGNPTVQAGAPNKYKITTHNALREPVEAQLSAQVIEKTSGKLLFKKDGFKSENGVASLTLPPDLAVKPNSEVTLKVIARAGDGRRQLLLEDFDLTAPVYLTHLATDKPMYQPGETVRFRSLTLERFSLEPVRERLALHYTITTPRNQPIPVPQGNLSRLARGGSLDGAAAFGPHNETLRGIGGGEWTIPDNRDNFPGGEYTLTIADAEGRFPPQHRKFIVNRYEKPRLNKELDFTRRSYGPGDEVVASCTATRAEGGPVANRRVTATVNIDGKTYDAKGKPGDAPLALTTNAEGEVNVRFKLPEKIDRGRASLNVVFFDGGSPEALTKPIPIVLKKLDVDFYPEGGYLVAGVPNRVYFQVRTTLGKPAELEGRLVDERGAIVAKLQTLSDDQEPGANQGMGVFRLTPAAGETYSLKIDRPAGMTSEHTLRADAEGVVALTVPSPVTTSHEPIDVRLRAVGRDRGLLVGAYCRGRLFDHQRIDAPAGEEVAVTLYPADGAEGVYRITVFEERPGDSARPALIPRAERLIFRHQRDRLNLAVKTDKDAYVPGDRVRMTLTARDENQQPTPAVLMAAVVDKSVVTLADEKTARSMPTHFYLTSEVREPEDLEYADFLLTSHPKAAEALDLLLGTQGWRRFAEQQPDEFRRKNQAAGAPALAMLSPTELPRVTAARGGRDVEAALGRKFAAAGREVDAAIQGRHEDLAARVSALKDEIEQVKSAPAYLALGRKLEGYADFAAGVRTFFPLLGLVLVIVAAVLVGRALGHAPRRAVPAFAGAAACLALLLTFGVIILRGPEPAGDRAPAVKREFALEEGKTTRATRPAAGGEAAAPADKPALANDFTDNASREDAAPPPPKAVMPEAPPMPAPPGVGTARGAAPGGLGFAGIGGFGGQADSGYFPGVPEKAGDAGVPRFGGFGGGFGGFAGGAATGPTGEPMFQRFAHERGREWKGAAPRKPGAGRGGANRDTAKEFRRAEGKAGKARQTERERMLRQMRGAKGGEAATFFVRQYAHTRQPGSAPAARSDWTETVYWHPALVLPGGSAEVAFDLSDAVTRYEVTVYGHTRDGRLATAAHTFAARLPFTLSPAAPLEVTASDKLTVPVTVANNTDQKRDVTVKLTDHYGLKLLKGGPERRLAVNPDERTRELFFFQPTLRDGRATLEFQGEAKPYAADAVRRAIRVVPEGFPVEESRGDLLEGLARHEVILPETWVKGTLKLGARAYPSTLADLQQGLEGLLRQPNGCFEQASSSNYPNVLILNYLEAADQTRPEVERRARELLERGYRKLISFECLDPAKNTRRGYEWFGGSVPPHEALTAYGLLQFRDMARVHAVDRAMLERTRKYLMAQKDGKGGFKRNPKSIDSFGRAPDHITDAYIVWALTESGPEDDVALELETLHKKAKDSKDPYFLALVANSLINRAKTADAVRLLQKVADAQKDDGHLDAAQTSITGSGGRDLQIETTALAVLGWLQADPGRFNVPVRKAVEWIGKQRGGHGAFGSTQSTILALKALIAYTKANKRPREGGQLTLHVNGREAAKLPFTAQSREVLELKLPDAAKHLKPGKNDVRLEVSGQNQFPYTLAWSYKTLKPASAEKAPVRLSTSLDRNRVAEGDSVRLTVKLENVTNKGQGMAVAVVGLPGGVTIPEDMKQLKEHQRLPKDGTRPLVSAFEVKGRELVLYWRDLAPNQQIEVPIDLSCRVPGEYSGPAGRAYLYYNSDHKHWSDPLKITITPGGD